MIKVPTSFLLVFDRIDLTGEGEYSETTGSEAEQPCLTLDSIGFEVDPESVKNLTFIDLPLSSFLSGNRLIRSISSYFRC